ncbi:4477_t:CDS:2 [Gigaspora rosea]|nr:4477_t:CDS:2 [Gigaspora rosea]
MVNEDISDSTVQIIVDQAKLEKVSYKTVPDYEKPDNHIQSPNNENVLPLENMQSEALLTNLLINTIAINQGRLWLMWIT